MKQAYKNVDTTLQNAVSSINKENGTCDISAVSQYISKWPANILLGWGSASAPHVKAKIVHTVLGSANFGKIFFFPSLPPPNLCLVLLNQDKVTVMLTALL